VINISNFTSENNPQAEPVTPPRRPPPWASDQAAPDQAAPEQAAPDQATDVTAQASPARFGRILAIVGRVLLSWLTAIPRRLGDRLFVMNDTEAYWRGWQITKTHGGLARRYRDPRFDTLAECPKCHGAGVTADLRCPPCLGTGRITLGEVS
jgi:hypothetical protein